MSSVQFGNYKQAVARLLLPLTGKMASRLCVQQKSFIEETLKTIFNNILSNDELNRTLLRKDLRLIKDDVVDLTNTDSRRIEIEMYPYYVIWTKFFKKAKHAGLGNPYAVLDPLQVKRFAELYEKKITNIKDHASKVLWDVLSKEIPTTTFKDLKTLSAFRTWMSEEVSQEWIGQISKLELSGKQLKVIPEEIKWLPKLKTLSLNNNQILSIPTRFLCPANEWCHRYEWEDPLLTGEYAGMKHLDELHLNRNQIQAIPKFIFGLPELKYFFLQGNQIGFLPDNIQYGFENIRIRIFLHNNPIPTTQQSGENEKSYRIVMMPVESFSRMNPRKDRNGLVIKGAPEVVFIDGIPLSVEKDL